MHLIRFQLGLRPRPRWGRSQRSPRLSSCILGVLLLRKRRGREENGEGENRRKTRRTKGKDKKGRRRGPQYTLLATPLRKKGERQQKGEKTKKINGRGAGRASELGERLPPGAEGEWTTLEKRERGGHPSWVGNVTSWC